MAKSVHIWMPEQGELGVIQLWFSVKKGVQPKWVEVRGNPYSEWAVDEDTPMFHLHSALEGWHATVLHQDARLDIHDRHPDYEAVVKFLGEEE